MLASGLPDIVADDEDLARFLTSSSQFNIRMAKPAAFLPSASDRETSVFRHGAEPLRELGRLVNSTWQTIVRCIPRQSYKPVMYGSPCLT